MPRIPSVDTKFRRQQLEVSKEGKALADSFEKVLDSANAAIVTQVSTNITNLSTTNNAAFLKMVSEVINHTDAALTKFRNNIIIRASVFSLQESIFVIETLNDTIAPFKISSRHTVDRIPVNQKLAIGKSVTEILTELRFKIINMLRQQFHKAKLQRWTLDQFLRSIKGTSTRRYRNGLFHTFRRYANSSIKTILAYSQTYSRISVFKRTTRTVLGYALDSINDSNAECKTLKDKEFTFNQGILPPVHYACSLFIVPIFNRTIMEA